MQYLILALLLLWTRCACRRIRQSPRLYRRCAWTLGLLVYAAMLTQEAVLLLSGQLDWSSGLPLHLCSLLGVLTLPMLLTCSRILCSAALFIGVPGAALAVIFPAVLRTPWPMLTAIAFHTLHAGLICAPWLVIARGWRPAAADAWRAGLVLLAAGAAAMVVNPLVGGNYLFLAVPVPGTPLAWLGQWGIWAYRALLAGLAGMTLAAGAATAALAQKRSARICRTLP